MKRLILAAVMGFCLFGTSTIHAQSQGENGPPVIELVFGRPSKGCLGFGICKFAVHLSRQDIKELATVIALLRPDGSIKVKMPEDVYKSNLGQFKSGYLVVEEDYPIDKATTRAIGAKDGYTIKKGKYAVTLDKSTNTYDFSF